MVIVNIYMWVWLCKKWVFWGWVIVKKLKIGLSSGVEELLEKDEEWRQECDWKLCNKAFEEEIVLKD